MRKSIQIGLLAGFLASSATLSWGADNGVSGFFRKKVKARADSTLASKNLPLKPRFAVPRNPNDVILQIPREPQTLSKDPDTRALRQS